MRLGIYSIFIDAKIAPECIFALVSSLACFSTTPSSLPVQDQFMYCHDLLLEYVDSFEGYSNFNQ